MINRQVYLGGVLHLILYGLVAGTVAADVVDQAIHQEISQTQTAERSVLLRALRGKTPVLMDSQSLMPMLPSDIEQSVSASDFESSQAPVVPRIQGGDTILLQLDSKLDSKQVDDGSTQPRLPDKRIFVLDQAGGLAIPNFGRIIIAGLTEQEAAQRIAAEPAFQGFTVSVQRLPVDQELQLFGYDLFQDVPDTFAPATDIPIPAEYVIGPGDVVLVQLFGKENVQYDLVITRDGMLLFPGIGPIPVLGLKFSQLQQEIYKRVENQLIGVKASVTLGRLRSIRVFILGDVNKPGSYTVSGLSTLTNALFVSGGVKTIGSLRNIQLKRNGKIVSRLDLYDLLLRGDTSADVRLLPGDVIFVPPIGKTVGISGQARRPAIYEFKNEQSIAELIAMAGGLLPSAYQQGAQIQRIEANRQRTLLDIDLTEESARELALHDGDILRIASVLDQVNHVVTLSGHVHRPGDYQWSQGMHLMDLITTMGMVRSEADRRYLLIRRENPIDRSIQLLSTNLVNAIQNPRSPSNIALMARDEVIVFDIHTDRSLIIQPMLDQAKAVSTPEQPLREVSIQGSVHHPGRYPLSPQMTVRELLSAAGGLTDKAFTLEAELTRFNIIDGQRREQSIKNLLLEDILKSENHRDITLAPYDQLTIRRLPNWDETGAIEIVGEVKFPGSYPISRGENLLQVIERAGGLTKEAYTKGAVFLRESIRVREQQHLNRLASQLERDLNFINAEQGRERAADEAGILLVQVRTAEAIGRMVIDLEKLIAPNGEQNFTIQPGDRLYVPQRPEEVTVIGEVNFPTSHLYTRKIKKKEYIRLSGGITGHANKRSIYVVHTDGSVSSSRGWFGRDAKIRPGDTIVVPPKVDRISKLKLYTDVSQVLYQLALTAASLKVLNVF